MMKSIGKITVLGVLFWGLWGCVSLKQNELYVDVPNPNDTVFHASSEIYADYMTSEIWFTKSDPCLSVNTTESAAYQGELGLHLKWDKNAIGCPWLGMGFGWDNWTGKDLSEIKNTGAIEFYVRMLEGSRPSLPWAMALEDFSGSQAWLGVSANAVKAEAITTEWTRIELPLSEFNWDEQDADAGNIKQILIQFEADGELFMDEIRLVEYKGGFRKRYEYAELDPADFVVDGQKGDAFWNWTSAKVGDDQMWLGVMDGYLCVAAEVTDDTPLQNGQSYRDIFNGDALEIAFSSRWDVNPRRTLYRSTDQHFGIGLGDIPTVWNWRKEAPVEGAEIKTQKTSTGYLVEAKIPFASLDIEPWEARQLYGLELAIDHGNMESRTKQVRWNNPAVDGFYQNPALWGEIIGGVSKEMTP
ncbi:MAG: hypothetical protein SchgKO_09730 [Schleiferiaceae bacterium]